jgi:hypothetical protein
MTMRPKTPAPDAETLALQALAFLAADDDRLSQFLNLTGLDVGQLRRLAQDPPALGLVLDYLLNWEPLLLEFAAAQEIAPEIVMQVRRRLPGATEY